jgi:hypothetical protein
LFVPEAPVILLILESLLTLWLCWILFHFAMIGAVSFIVTPDAPCYTGLRIIIPGWLVELLSPLELRAVMAHEEGHRYHLHVWRNFARRCVFLPVSRARIGDQEREADEYAAARGHRYALEMARAKIRGRKS